MNHKCGMSAYCRDARGRRQEPEDEDLIGFGFVQIQIWRLSMRRTLLAVALLSCVIHSSLHSQQQQAEPAGHYLFAWTGDVENKGNDFLAVIDADPASKSYGRLATTLVTDQRSVRIHHTDYVMPESGMLFANDHDAGRTFIFDVRDPLHPKTVTSFTDMAGYMHPH